MSDMYIKVKSEVLVSTSADVTQKITKVRNAFEDLDSIIKNTLSYWEGDGRNAFAEAYQIRRDDYERIFSMFQEHVTNLQQIAGVYDEAERMASSYVNELPGDVIV